MPTKPKPLPSIEDLSRILEYDHHTGNLIWKYRPEFEGLSWNSKLAGKPAGCIHPRGHIVVKTPWGFFRAHRIIFKMLHGWEPPEVDHHDLNPSNNRPDNLRPATFAQSQHNKKANKNNKLGLKGVRLDKRHGTYWSSIMVNRKHHFLGRFKTAEEAHAAYTAASAKLHGEFSRAA